MNVHIKPELAAWLEMQVQSGAFPSIDSAIEHSITLAKDDDTAIRSLDLSWTRPLIEQAETSIALEMGVDAEDAFKRIDEYVKTIR